MAAQVKRKASAQILDGLEHRPQESGPGSQQGNVPHQVL
jgi:hypothetical protein